MEYKIDDLTVKQTAESAFAEHYARVKSQHPQIDPSHRMVMWTAFLAGMSLGLEVAGQVSKQVDSK